MRTIKFRAWHKIRNEMYPVWGITKEYIWMDTLNGVGNKGIPDKIEDIELMQFTGLLDKNGKEIYEGDIINQTAEGTYINFSSDDTVSIDRLYTGQVVITASKGACIRKPKFKNNNTGEIEKADYYLNIVQYRCEVIGNIYENKSLLND